MRKLIWKENWKSCTFKLDDGFGIGEEVQCLSGPEEEIDSFLDKFVFAVNTPNEVELDVIMKNELGKYYNLLVSDVQFNHFSNTMLDWFKNKDSQWMTSDEGIRILADIQEKVDQSRRSVLIDYGNQINKIAEITDTATQEMAEKLKPFLASSDKLENINYIRTDWPDFTALKVIAAIKTLPNFKFTDSYMVISSKHAQKKEDFQDLRRMFSNGKAHHLLVIVCEDHSPISYDKYVNLVADSEEKKILLIVKKGTDVRPQLLINEDVISYGQLSENFKNVLLSKKVSFQGKDMPVRDLIPPDKAENVLDWESIKMLAAQNKIVVPSFNTTRFERSLYIKRRMALPFEFDSKFWENLAEDMKCSKTLLMSECKFNTKGAIVWSASEERKVEIWEKIKIKLSDRSTLGLPANANISEDELIFDKKWKNSAIVISGGAGTGKSTVLSHYCETIKKTKPTRWISRINLVDYCEILSKFEPKMKDNSSNEEDEEDFSTTIDFFVDELNIRDCENAFSRSLLRHQLKMGDNRVVVMLDGFDEISSQFQEKAIHLMKAIIANKSVQLIVTTRPHMMDQLQLQLSQLAYSLENFTEKDQIDYLSEYWETNLKELEDKSVVIRKFSEYFVQRVSQTLKDKEKSFIGIPLQCRLMAECFQSDLQGIIKENRNDSEIQKLLDGQKFDLATMYNRLMETKRRVFLQEKISVSAPNPIVAYAIDSFIKKIEFHLTKLAIETIFIDQGTVNLLCPPNSQHQSKFEKAAEEKAFAECGLKFGLTFHNGEKVQFLHRTLAEYLVAKFFFQGFSLDQEKHNGLLDKSVVRDLIFSVVMTKNNGIYDGVQMFFDSFLAELVDEDEEWRNIIDKRLKNKFPERFKSFMNGIINKQQSVYVVDPNILDVPIIQRNTNLFKFICDCLDMMIEPVKLRKSMSSLFRVICKFFYEQSSDAYKRLLSYFSSPSEIEFINILSHILYYPMQIYQDDLFWNEVEKKKILKLVLDFMGKNLATLKRILKNRPNVVDVMQMKFALHFFMCNDYYDNELKQYLELLSFAYSSEPSFLNLFGATFNISESHFGSFQLNGKMEKTVIILRNLGRIRVLEALSHVVLLRDPEVFRRYYEPSLSLDETDVVSTNLHQMLARDQYRMTRLDRAAFRGDTGAVDRILQTLRHSLSSAETNEKVMKTAKEVVDDIVFRESQEFTSFFVAAAFGHEEICRKLLIFFKELVNMKVLPLKQLQDFYVSPNGMIYSAAQLAIRFLKLPMFRLILTSVKQIMGQRPLVFLLKQFILNNKEWFETLAEIVVDGTDGTTGYQQLNEIVLQDSSTLEALRIVEKETFNQMVSVDGVEKWTKCLLDIDLPKGFHLLSRHHLSHFDRTQMRSFIKTIITDSSGQENSYWDRLLLLSAQDFPCNDFEIDFDHILKCAWDKLVQGKERLVLCRFNGITGFLLSLCESFWFYGDKSLGYRLLDFVKERQDEEVIRRMMKCMPTFLHYVMDPFGKIPVRGTVIQTRMKVLEFALDHAGHLSNTRQFSDLVDALLIPLVDYDGRTRSIWCYQFRFDFFYAEEVVASRVGQFLSWVSTKLNKRKVKELVTHRYEDESGSTNVIFYLASKHRRSLVEIMLSHLEESDRREIRLIAAASGCLM
ncbi:uncharacterized protein LOC124204695 isoform X2 [Daphnia pulex]|nr:uncharacterized protein LOC124204695 isoform X2 [Daphnia pulex]XP_046457773.1 uncharacterized protein LOC124204695 isoform X2 [Daphnia pulex]